MPIIGQGASITLEGRYRDGVGTLVDPVNPLVDILDPLGANQITDAVPVRVSTGEYRYVYAVGVVAMLGSWTIHWTGVINGSPVAGDEVFTVVAAGSITPSGTPWISLVDAEALTGDSSLTDDLLRSAARDVYSLMRWEPVYGTDLATDDDAFARAALGEAIAWQASYRRMYPPSAIPTPSIKGERIGEYSVDYDVPTAGGVLVNSRSVTLLARAGLMRLTGWTHLWPARVPDLDWSNSIPWD